MPSPTTPKPNTCVAYCRVSSKEQVEGTSLETQEKQCREFAERSGWNVLQVFVELGESAKSADRTEFNKAIAFCNKKKNSVGYFVVYKLDRFARNQEDHVIVRGILRRSGTELRSATEKIDESPMGKAMEGIMSVIAELDNNVRTVRTTEGMIQRVHEGIWVWLPPLAITSQLWERKPISY
ncbi:MAG: recombinase family protein [Planctomycetota bacterium]